MKTILVMGSTTLDIIVNVPRLPQSTQDVNVLSQSMSVGGCAYNVAHMLKLYDLPYVLCSAIGGGLFGDYVHEALQRENMKPIKTIKDQVSGCCYCFIEPSGERTFVSHHGVEYTFNPEWLKDYDMSTFNAVYFCGIDLEEETGQAMLDFIRKHPHLHVYFAPGPRIHLIEKQKLDQVWALKPIVHLNKSELLDYTQEVSLLEGAQKLNALCHNTLIITDGDNGAYYFDKDSDPQLHRVSAYPVPEVVNTIGAGDSHIGTLIAEHALGQSWLDAIKKANAISARIVTSDKSTLTHL